ncbi:unnamed protein product [Trichogramma brassicae]|uniref:Uncharacterized protein n=1 Tax=Trichogramma brassicae TaxID=86971 RepID=A0A6H5IAN6_9HYME|nr:unnamed protein product [Trichogramma brassicae]
MSRGAQARVVRLVGESPATHTSRFVYPDAPTMHHPRNNDDDSLERAHVTQFRRETRTMLYYDARTRGIKVARSTRWSRESIRFAASIEMYNTKKYDTRGARAANVVLFKNTYFVFVNIIRYGLVARISGFHPEGSGSIPVPGKRFTCAATREREREINDRISRARKREYEEDDLLRGSANCYRQNIVCVRGYTRGRRASSYIYK